MVPSVCFVFLRYFFSHQKVEFFFWGGGCFTFKGSPVSRPPTHPHTHAHKKEKNTPSSPVPGTVGTPHASAALLAAVLSPIASIVSGRGPTNAIPSSSHRRAKFAFSDKKPYPGWMTSTPWALAMEMMPSMSR